MVDEDEYDNQVMLLCNSHLLINQSKSTCSA